MHYLVGDALHYAFDKEDRPQYVEWLIDVFAVTRFFCALAVIPRVNFEQVRALLIAILVFCCAFMRNG